MNSRVSYDRDLELPAGLNHVFDLLRVGPRANLDFYEGNRNNLSYTVQSPSLKKLPRICGMDCASTDLVCTPDLFRSDLRQSDMIELALCDETSKGTHLVLYLVLISYTGAFEVVQPLRTAELSDDTVDTLPKILWAEIFVQVSEIFNLLIDRDR